MDRTWCGPEEDVFLVLEDRLVESFGLPDEEVSRSVSPRMKREASVQSTIVVFIPEEEEFRCFLEVVADDGATWQCRADRCSRWLDLVEGSFDWDTSVVSTRLATFGRVVLDRTQYLESELYLEGRGLWSGHRRRWILETGVSVSFLFLLESIGSARRGRGLSGGSDQLSRWFSSLREDLS